MVKHVKNNWLLQINKVQVFSLHELILLPVISGVSFNLGVIIIKLDCVVIDLDVVTVTICVFINFRYVGVVITRPIVVLLQHVRENF